MKIYVVTRDCCLGPNYVYDHGAGKKRIVEQLRTFSETSARKCQTKFTEAGYNATLAEEEVKSLRVAYNPPSPVTRR